MMTSVILGLGSNIEPRVGHIQKAVALIKEHPRITLRQCSSLYHTEPVGYAEQGWFLNAVAACDTDLEPLDLLHATKTMEAQLMRERTIHWGPRTIDIDLVLFGQAEINLPNLVVPHPRCFQRAFVLVPLAEITGGQAVYRGKTAQELLADLGGHEAVEYYGPLEED